MAPHGTFQTVDGKRATDGLIDGGDRFLPDPTLEIRSAGIQRNAENRTQEQNGAAERDPFQNGANFLMA